MDKQQNTQQPEPVNQQLLAALKMVLDDPDALGLQNQGLIEQRQSFEILQ